MIPMEASARRATPTDLLGLERLATAALAEKRSQRGGEIWELLDLPETPLSETLRAGLSDPEQLVAVGEIDRSAVGMALARLLRPAAGGPPIADLVAIHVEEAARGVGVGEALMEMVLEWASDNDCRGVDSTALPGDRATKNFFESFGLVARSIKVHRRL